MLGRRDPQRSFFGAASQVEEGSLEKLGFYGKLSTEGPKVFRDEDFAAAYCRDNGRPSVPPSILAMARLLQHYEGISDEEVVERCRYDLRWKVALDLDPLSVAAPFAKSTFQGFRARLTVHEKEGLIFEKSVEAAREAGLLPRQLRLALDSSPVRGRGAVKDTFNLISDAIKAVVRSVSASGQRQAQEVAEEAGLERHVEAASIKGSEVVEWEDTESVAQFLRGLLEDAEKAVTLAKEAGCGSEEAALLRKIVMQDVDQEGQSPEIRRGVAKARTVSVSDPEMRHGRKSSGSTYTGHKAHVAVEIKSSVITAVAAGAPGEADGARVKSLVEQSEQSTGHKVEQALGDCAYSSREAAKQAAEVGVDLKTKMPKPRKGFFGSQEFKVSEETGEAHCPAGQPSSEQSPLHPKGSVPGLNHRWSEQQCGSCPLKELCTPGKRRSLFVPVDFHQRRQREEYARSEEGRRLLRRRVVVEHAIAKLKNLGAGAARYFGREKTKTQWQWSAAVLNFRLVWFC